MSAEITLDIPARSAYVGVARLALSSLARAAGLDETKTDDLRIAVSEALANAVLSTEAVAPEEPVTMIWTETDDRIHVEVADRGETYDPQSLADTDTRTLRSVLSLALLESLVDECDFAPREGGGMRTLLAVTR